MSPLRSSTSSSPVYTHSSQKIDHLSNPSTSSNISTDDSKAPKPKKPRLQTSSSPIYILSSSRHLHSSGKKYEPEATTCTNEASKELKTTTQKQPTLYEEKIEALKQENISLEEFIGIYNDVPIRERKNKFHALCRNYLYNLFQSKTSIEEKKNTFLSLPKSLTTSIPLFTLLFKEEASILSGITRGETDTKQLPISIDRLIQFLSPTYLKAQICKYVKQKQPLSEDDKTIVAECRKKLRAEEEKKLIPQTISYNAPLTEYSSSSEEESEEELSPKKHKKKLHKEAVEILDSLENETIETESIIPSRKKLILLGVDKSIIKQSFRRFNRTIKKSSRPDKEKILQAIYKSGKQTARIKSKYSHTSDRLELLLGQAHAGTLPLENLQELRNLLFKEYILAKASSHFQNVKRTLIKHNKANEPAILEAFKKAYTKQAKNPHKHQELQAKIKSGNIDVDTFTLIYDSIPQSDRTGTLSKMCSTYIKKLSDTTPDVLEEKIKLLKSLPLSLQKSASTLNTIFPKEHACMTQIRLGKIPSWDIKEACIQLLKITEVKHLSGLIDNYVTANKQLSTDDKQHIADCRAFIKQHALTLPTHKKASHKTKKYSSSESSDSLIKEHSYPSKKNQYGNKLIPLTTQISPTLTDASIIGIFSTSTPCATWINQTSLQPSTSHYVESSLEPISLTAQMLPLLTESSINDTSSTNTQCATWIDQTSPQPSTSHYVESSLEPISLTAQMLPLLTESSINDTSRTSTQCATWIDRTSPQPSTSHYVESSLEPISLTAQMLPLLTDESIGDTSSTSTQCATWIDLTSPQPSTSHYVESISETVKLPSLEEISPNELTCILQSISDEDGSSEDSIILKRYLLQLAQEVQEEQDTVEPTTSQPKESTSTSQSNTHTATIDTQKNNIDEPLPDEDEQPVPEEFVSITEIAAALKTEELIALADTVEDTMHLEEFFDFSNIDDE